MGLNNRLKFLSNTLSVCLVLAATNSHATNLKCNDVLEFKYVPINNYTQSLQLVNSPTIRVPEEASIQMGTDSEARNEATVFNFKNKAVEGFSPRVIDVKTPHIPSYLRARANSAMGVDQEARAEIRSRLKPYLDEIEALRKGDLVHFQASYDEWDNVRVPERTFRLGNFVGAGNSVHIFELADHPGWAIRIPFTKPKPFLKWYAGTEDYGQNAPNIVGVRRIKVFEYHEDFAVVELVSGRESSQSYLKHFEPLFTSPLNLDDVVEKLKSRGQSAEAIKLGKLVLVLKTSGALYGWNLDYTRQFTYDESTEEWVLTDWE